MTTPYQHNCFHIPEGWCLKCVAELQQQLEDCKRDTARMDWLEKQEATVHLVRWGDVLSSTLFCWDVGKIRSTVDEAMKEEK